MTERTYPYAAWTLMPSFKPALVNISECYHSFGGSDGWERTSSGKLIHTNDLFSTKEAAITAGWERINAQEVKLAKMRASIDKKREALAKATGAAQ